MKSIIKSYIRAVLIMMVIPILFFFFIHFIVTPLDPKIFSIVSVGAYYSFCINALIHISKKEKGWKLYIQWILFPVIFPIIAIYGISFFTPEILYASTFGGLILGVVTGVCWGRGFEIMAQEEKKLRK